MRILNCVSLVQIITKFQVQILLIVLLMIKRKLLWSNRWRIIIVTTSSMNGIFIIFVRKINLSFFATDFSSFFVISSSSFFCSVECTKPNTNSFSWITNLCSPFSPWTLSNPSVEILPLFFQWLLSSFTNCSKEKPNEKNLNKCKRTR